MNIKKMKTGVLLVLAFVFLHLEQSEASSLKKLFEKVHDDSKKDVKSEDPECSVHWEEQTEPYCTTTYEGVGCTFSHFC